jgi:hypothetical protein
MTAKIASANEVFKTIYKKSLLNDDSPNLRTLPQEKIFKNITTIEDDLFEFLNLFHTTKNKTEPENIVIEGISYSDTKNSIASEVINYLGYSEMLLSHPWRIAYCHISNYLHDFYFQRINGSVGNNLKTAIEGRFNFPIITTKYDTYYPFVFLTNGIFDVNVNNYIKRINIPIVLGKRRNGSFHLLSPQNNSINNLTELFSFF